MTGANRAPQADAPGARTPEASRRATAVIGLQWGDEGKGKIVDLLTPRHDAVARFNGGANAGHSVVVGGERFALHLLPSGILHRGKPALIGSGVVVDPAQLLKEIAGLTARGVDCSALRLSPRAHVVMPWHKAEDEARELWAGAIAQAAAGSQGRGAGGAIQPIGTTRRGIGPCYADKALRAGAVRVGDLLDAEALGARLRAIAPMKQATLDALRAGAGLAAEPIDVGALTEQAAGWGAALRPFVADTSAWLLEAIAAGKRVLFEGANATLLDVDHGTYPFVTSSSCFAGGVATGAGVPPGVLGEVIGVCKAYTSRVGSGAMPTELSGELGERIRQRGREFGTTTGRPRRVGWLDLVAVRYAARLNGCTALALMLLDVLADLDELRVCVAYEAPQGRLEGFPPDGVALARCTGVYETLAGFRGDVSAARRFDELPPPARAYVECVERFTGVPVRFVSVGPDRAQTIERV